MRYIIEVYDRKKTYYFYPSPYGNIMTDDPWKALSTGFQSVEGAEDFFNNSQESFRELFLSCDVLAVKIVGVKASMEDVCGLTIKDVCKIK